MCLTVDRPIGEVFGYHFRAGRAQRESETVFVTPSVRIPAARADSIPGGESSIARHSLAARAFFPSASRFSFSFSSPFR